MVALRAIAMAALILPATVAPSAAQCDARSVLEHLRMATGGHRWTDVKEILAAGAITDSGAVGTFRAERDLIAGRSSFSESLDVGRVGYLFDGSTLWEQDQGLGVHALDASESRARAITQSYLDRNGFWHGPSDPARFSCSSGASTVDAAYDIIRVTPRGGSEVDLWIDRSTHVLDRTAEQLPTTTRTRSYQDYRWVHGLLVPFEITDRFTDGYGNPAVTTQRFTSYQLLSAVRDSDFHRPADPDNGRLRDQRTTTNIPFSLDKGVIVFNAKVNGHGPFAFTLDPGAQGALTTVASRPLGLKPGTMATVGRLNVGDAEIDNIALPVYAGKPTDLFPERDPRKSPIAGSLGPELLDRFAVTLDYATQTMSLSQPRSFRCSPPSVAQLFTLQQDDDIPLVPATIDGHTGRLQFDVRAPGSLVVFLPFLEGTGLAARYPAGRGNVHTLVMGGVTLLDIPAHFTADSAGKFASRTEAGVAGYRLLSRFTTTLDYRTHTICFAHSRN